MTPLDAQPVLDAVLSLLSACRGNGPGAYSRVPADPGQGGIKPPDPLACAAAAHILYMLGVFPGRSSERDAWIDILRGFQDPETGLVKVDGIADLRATAACAAALECFDVPPSHAPRALMEHATPRDLPAFLNLLPWDEDAEEAGETAAAVFTVLVLTSTVGRDWENAWFRWFEAQNDAHTGLTGKGGISPVSLLGHWTLLPHVSGHARVLFSHVHARVPHPHPWRLTDTLLDMLEINQSIFSVVPDAREFSLVFSLCRSMRITAHRHEEALRALRRFTYRHLSFLETQAKSGKLLDLVVASRVVCLLAELQQTLPGAIHTRRPLRQILDRRPWI